MEVGDIFYTSYGYDMTINHYVKIVSVSPTKKTVMARMLKVEIKDDNGQGSGTSNPTNEEIGEAFRLSVRVWNDAVHLVGKYPFCAESGNFTKIRGSFSKWDGKPNYYNTWD